MAAVKIHEMVSIPLNSGHGADQLKGGLGGNLKVSIPLNSGHGADNVALVHTDKPAESQSL